MRGFSKPTIYLPTGPKTQVPPPWRRGLRCGEVRHPPSTQGQHLADSQRVGLQRADPRRPLPAPNPGQEGYARLVIGSPYRHPWSLRPRAEAGPCLPRAQPAPAQTRPTSWKTGRPGITLGDMSFPQTPTLAHVPGPGSRGLGPEPRAHPMATPTPHPSRPVRTCRPTPGRLEAYERPTQLSFSEPLITEQLPGLAVQVTLILGKPVTQQSLE